MKFAALIYSDETNPEVNPDPSSPEFGPIMEGYMGFGAKYRDKISAGEALQPTPTATSVQVRNGETVTTDGPFAETKEHLGGFYILECADLDEAIATAADIPHAATGTIEVRPVAVFDGVE